MKKHLKLLIIYIFVVFVPTIIGSSYFIHLRSIINLNERINEANWIASIHESHWDKFISGTVTSLEMISMTAKTLFADLEQMKPLLEKAHQSDPRYGGIYLVGKNGEIIAGSNQHLHESNYIEKELVDEVMKTKDVIISNKSFSLENGQTVIGISYPILAENNELMAVSLALLRIDYVENLMKVLTPDSKILLLSANENILMTFNIKKTDKIEDLSNEEKWVTYPIERLPWKIKVKVDEEEKTAIYSLIIIGIHLILTHILFLLINYLLLKRQAAIERKENEVQKLELVGTLAASTAHEIRNPLTGIKGLVQLLSEKYDEPTDRMYFSVIDKEIERINEIVSEFLILGKPTAQKMEIVDISGVLRELYPLILSEATFNRVHLHYEVVPEPVLVKCTKDQMKQVILNITRNAFEAMKGEIKCDGILTIELRKENHLCEIIITDTGVGINEKVIEQIFTPFYTSKETGTGLGLVVCKRILQSFNGEILITSEEHKGTTVTLKLPLIGSS
ncbi:sensor histidine kinase [Robertmurraya siralis]|uniref:histidine kinase n=1 Tax=Robertmurraya siralis TaxID=77777 RepID=A0A920BSU8_9BACI|nr:PAS domain-containing sensor histidine kinase [Robertmurraya siralis]PAE19006.1 two-component sensor histidine kinase [Bacillus sp. 7504-2]GIN61308.1 sensor histidine kinase [Robertmurraya siralis]